MKPAHQILHQKFKQYGANAKEWTRKCILLLPEIEKHRIWEQKGFGSIYGYAAKLAGMSRNTVDDALRILKRIEDKPELQKVVALKGINAVRPVAAIATNETAEFWAEKATQMSKHTLEVYVKELSQNPAIETKSENLRTGTGNNAESPYQQAISNSKTLNSESLFSGEKSAEREVANQEFFAPKKIVAMELEPEILEQLEKLKGQGGWNDLMKQFLQLREQQLEEQKPEAVKTESRHIPNKIQHYIVARTNGVCAFPGCKKSIEIKHHTQRFALEKVHDPDRLYGLCQEHERIAHLGLIEHEEKPPADWKVRKEPDRTAPKFKVDQLVGRYRARVGGT